MAISDTLSDAAAEIRDYLENQPSMYAEKRADILWVVNRMDSLRRQLDQWGKDNPIGPNASVHEALRAATSAATKI